MELERNYKIKANETKPEHKEQIENLKKMMKENIQKDLYFSELVSHFKIKIEKDELESFLKKNYGEKVQQNTAQQAYAVLLRDKLSKECMKSFKSNKTKIKLDEFMKLGHNNELSPNSN